MDHEEKNIDWNWLNGEYLQREKNSLEFADATVLTFISLQFNLDPFYG